MFAKNTTNKNTGKAKGYKKTKYFVATGNKKEFSSAPEKYNAFSWEIKLLKLGLFSYAIFFAIAVWGMYELKNNLFKIIFNEKPKIEKINGNLIALKEKIKFDNIFWLLKFDRKLIIK